MCQVECNILFMHVKHVYFRSNTSDRQRLWYLDPEVIRELQSWLCMAPDHAPNRYFILDPSCPSRFACVVAQAHSWCVSGCVRTSHFLTDLDSNAVSPGPSGMLILTILLPRPAGSQQVRRHHPDSWMLIHVLRRWKAWAPCGE